ncbi:hypothetical protein F5J12DRAFT_838848 [Pisolithus orientalis]|uniref:uncharacterized protein n=1 Tax=Pisolithus orientalis TaxID=936130 RepID=UPI0022246B43|nr:uncharacterized protein F5J12DRAFT_838848 [Pisolithus orientalis]KAI6003189.1 hypothetical protein F5J12DRAFT_838848 [Pisolithus orientalis]
MTSVSSKMPCAGSVCSYYPSADSSKVLLVFALDTINTLVDVYFYGRAFITCRWKTTYACTLEMPWDLSVAIGASFLVSFFVQCFYAHRIWIISNRNKLLTGAVLVAASAQLVFGFVLLGVARTGNIATLFNSPYNPVNSLGSAVCDAIITASVLFYLRPSRTNLLRKDYHIQKLNLVYVQTGLITFLNALAIAILYYQDGIAGEYLTVAPGIVKSKTYLNALLAVLNARKLTRNQPAPPLEIPTLPTIH